MAVARKPSCGAASVLPILVGQQLLAIAWPTTSRTTTCLRHHSNQPQTIQRLHPSIPSLPSSQFPLSPQRLEVWVGWAWLVGICAVSCIAGITFLLGIARSYQKAAQLPTTNCGE